VSNGFCSDTARQSVTLDNFLKADFTVLEDNCHSEPVIFKSNSAGKITKHEWLFGDGLSGSGDSTMHVYGPPTRTTTYQVRYTVTDLFGCQKIMEKPVTIYVNCQIDVPNAFTPNGDTKNDLLFPLNAIKAEQLEFRVYNRWGQLIFETTDWKKGWDGRYSGKLQPSGTYVWMLQYIHRDTKQRVQKKGATQLIR
jgi:gliding motility-associated-like protein